MTRTALFAGLLLAAPLAAQSYWPHHNITLGIGAGLPQDEIKSFMKSSPGIQLGYGYRFVRYLQADLGLSITFGAANVRDFLPTQIGTFQIKDREYGVPLGGRAIAPLAGGRFLLAAGGGGMWLRYNTRVSQPSYYYRIDCPVCTARSGWASYALGNASYFLNSNQNFRIGVTTQFVRGHTNGEPVGDVPGTRTNDRWINVYAELGFSF
jgi:hypothetical protein